MKRLRRLPDSPALLLLALLAVGLIAGSVGYASAGSGRATSSPANSPPAGAVSGVVQSVAGGRLTIISADGARTFELPADVSVEALRPLDLPGVRTGDWLNVGAVPNAQTVFALTGLVVIPDALLRAPAP